MAASEMIFFSNFAYNFASFSASFLSAAMAENMTYEDFKAQCVGLVCRQLNTATVTPDQLQGHFNALNFPVQDLTSQDRLLVHVFDVIMDHRAPIDFNQLTHLYKRCCSEKDLSLLPPPFGLDGPCAHGRHGSVRGDHS